MTTLDSSKIPSRTGGNNRSDAPLKVPTRAELSSLPSKVFHQGEPDKADLLEVDWAGGKMIVKDFSSKKWWVRLLGRLQIRREHRAYRWLGRMPAVPGLIGRIDRYALALEKVDGERLAWSERRYTEAGSHIGKLRECLDRIHEAGVLHMDLRGRENVLLCPDGELVIVDLAGAVCLRPGSLLHRLFFRWLVVPDETAFMKWKLLLTPDDITPAEKEFMRRTERYRGLWFFNKKRR